MIFESLEITQQEYDKWIEGWPELYAKNQPGLPAWKILVASKKQQILEERLDKRIERMVACLQKWCGVAMGILGDKAQPDLDQPLPTKEEVEKFKVNVKNFFKNELYHSDSKTVKPHWLDQGIDLPPPWENLKEASWWAFCQEFRKL